jgi:hypothetical protein
MCGLLVLAFIVCMPGRARSQTINNPSPPSFEEHLKKRLPELAKELDSKNKPLLWMPQHLLKDGQHEADVTTGLTHPKYPFPKPLEKLPEDDPRTEQYEAELIKFHDNREKLLQLMQEHTILKAEHNKTWTKDSIADYSAEKNNEMERGFVVEPSIEKHGHRD